MSGAPGLGTLLIAAGLLMAAFGTRPILGLTPHDAAATALLGGAGLWMTSLVIDEFRSRPAHGLLSLLAWTTVFAALVTVVVQRDTALALFDRFIGEVAAGRAVATPAGEVVVARRADGSFTLAGQVNGRAVRFVFDTGASTVVLTAESAQAAGLRTEALDYSVPVSTANGRMMAAPVTLEAVTIGSIVERRVQALVARRGLLAENLLGMTFLDRLVSYEVRGNRLILRAKS
jgi:aspartyl protease family protein